MHAVWRTRAPGAVMALLGAALLIPVPPLSGSSSSQTAQRTIVAAVWGDNSAPGTAAAPVRTLKRAVALAPPGGRVLLRAGVYRGTIRITKPLTIRAYRDEKVWLDGARRVRSFQPTGSSWVAEDFSPRLSSERPNPLLIDPAHPLAGDPVQVFLGGKRLTQVGTTSELGPGRFFYDRDQAQLHLGEDPRGRRVAASVRAVALTLAPGAEGSVVRGLGFRRYGTHVSQRGAVRVQTDRITLLSNAFVRNAAAGLSVIGTDARVVGNYVKGNGQLGVHAHHADGLLLEDNRVVANNAEHFATGAAAGGAKITASRDVTVRANIFRRNRGQGVWLDMSCYGFDVVGNLARANAGAGVMVEVSARAVVASNVVVENRVGVLALEANDVDIWNNTAVRNGRGIEVLEGRRDAASGTGDGRFPPPYDRRHGSDPRILWNVQRVNVMNNVVAEGRPGSWSLIGVNDATRRRSAEQMGVRLDHNAYWRGPGSPVRFTHTWSDWPDSLRKFETLDEFVAATGQDSRSMASDGSPQNPWVTDEASGEWAIPPGSPAAGRGAPLPTIVADALGLPAGEPVDIGMLEPAGAPFP